MIRKLYCADEHHVSSAASALTSGQLVTYLSKLWMVSSLKAIAVGDPYTLVKNIVIELDKASSSTVFADGADVGIDLTNQNAVAAGAGDIDVKCRKASANGDTTVTVELVS